MQELSTLFRKLSTSGKIKFILIFPLLVLAKLADVLIDTIRVLINRCFTKLRISEYAKKTIVAVLISITAFFVIIHLDRTIPVFTGSTEYQAQEYVYTNCHEMTNVFIVAADGNIRGFKRADDNGIDRIIDVVKDYNFSDKELLITWLTQFRNGDYSNAVDFHNYCWEKLDGEIGYAVNLKWIFR